MNLDFLKNVTLADGQSLAVKAAKPRVTVGKTPTGENKLRLFSNGAIYPSPELVAKFSLEYVAKDNLVDNRFGFDVVDTRKFPNYMQLKETNPNLPHLLLISAVNKNQPKVDIFGTCTFVNEADVVKDPNLVLGAPRLSVLEQGSATFGREVLIPLLKELYGFEFKENQKYVDLIINTDYPIQSADRIAFVPKRIVKGEKAGQDSYERREDSVFYPLVIDESTVIEDEDEASETVDTDSGNGPGPDSAEFSDAAGVSGETTDASSPLMA